MLDWRFGGARGALLVRAGAAAPLLAGVLGCSGEPRGGSPDEVGPVAQKAAALGTFNVLTRSYDNKRSGANTSETVLTPANVNSNGFGKQFKINVDDQVYAQVNITNGADRSGSPHVISGSFAGTGDGSDGQNITFDPYYHNQRAGLAFANNTVYVAFGAYCDVRPYHGWLFAFDKTSLSLTGGSTPRRPRGSAAFGRPAPATHHIHNHKPPATSTHSWFRPFFPACVKESARCVSENEHASGCPGRSRTARVRVAAAHPAISSSRWSCSPSKSECQ